MRKKVKRKTILIDRIRYYDDKPDTCRKCFFWKNRKVGCVLGTQNCYYLAEAVKTEQEKKCEGCCYAKGHPCASAVCYKELDVWLISQRILCWQIISLEAKIAKNKDLYYDALNRAQHGWHEGTEDAVPFMKYLLGTILDAYKDFGDRFAIVEEKLPAIDMVRKAALNKIGRFTKQDIREQCPSLSLSSVEAALRKMVASGELKREGTGKSTCYIRLK